VMLFLYNRKVRFCGAVLFRAFANIMALLPLQVFPATVTSPSFELLVFSS